MVLKQDINPVAASIARRGSIFHQQAKTIFLLAFNVAHRMTIRVPLAYSFFFRNSILTRIYVFSIVSSVTLHFFLLSQMLLI